MQRRQSHVARWQIRGKVLRRTRRRYATRVARVGVIAPLEVVRIFERGEILAVVLMSGPPALGTALAAPSDHLNAVVA